MSETSIEKAVHLKWQHYYNYYQGNSDASRGLRDVQDVRFFLFIYYLKIMVSYRHGISSTFS